MLLRKAVPRALRRQLAVADQPAILRSWRARLPSHRSLRHVPITRVADDARSSVSNAEASASIRGGEVRDADEAMSGATDSAAEMLSGYGYTVSSMYVPKAERPIFQNVDHLARRRERDVKEICEAASRQGLAEEHMRSNISSLEKLLPDLRPDMNRMRASEWATLASDVNRVASLLIILKTVYPAANVSKIVGKSPRTLLMSPDEIQKDAAEVKALLSAVDREGELDNIIEAVPYLMSPRELRQSLGNLRSWFPSQDPVEVLRSNPSILLNIGESDIEADPLYGWTST